MQINKYLTKAAILKRKKILLSVGIPIIIVFIAFAIVQAKASSPGNIKATYSMFVLSSGKFSQAEDGTIVDSLDAKVGDIVNFQMKYDSNQSGKVSVDLFDDKGNSVLELGEYEVGENGEFSVAFNTKSLNAGVYEVAIRNLNTETVSAGRLKLR